MEELQPKESIKELKRHLARLEKEIEGKSRTCQNLRTGQPTKRTGANFGKGCNNQLDFNRRD
jgi:hypothetical protein